MTSMSRYRISDHNTYTERATLESRLVVLENELNNIAGKIIKLGDMNSKIFVPEHVYRELMCKYENQRDNVTAQIATVERKLHALNEYETMTVCAHDGCNRDILVCDAYADPQQPYVYYCADHRRGQS